MDDPLSEQGGSELAGRLILVTEDEYLIADALVEGLERFGALVVGPFPTVEAALAALRREPKLDCAVLDINLRGEMVYPLADALQARGIPFIFATGYDATVISPRFADIRRYEKPVTPSAIVRALRRL